MPIPVKGKSPVPKGATGRDGIVTAEKIIEWCNDPEWSGQNLAIRFEGAVGIDVDVYGEKRGDLTLAALEQELGPLPATPSSTARGAESDSRQHVYLLPPEVSPTARFVSGFTDIEILQRSHRYAIVFPSIHPETGEQYRWYDAEGELLDGIPSLDDFEYLPEAWIEKLSIPEDDGREHEGFTGALHEWLARCPAGEPSLFMRETIRGFAAVPDSRFNHDFLVSTQRALVGWAVEGEPGIPDALRALRNEWLRGEYDTEEYRRDFDAGILGAIAKFGALPLGPADVAAADHLPLMGHVPLALYTTLPNAEGLTPLRRRMGRIATIALEAELSVFDAVVLVSHSAASLALEATVEEVWTIVEGAQLAPVRDEEATPEPIVVAPAPVVQAKQIELLASDERVWLEAERAERAVTEDFLWWGDQFMAVQIRSHSILTESYYRLNRWFILANIFGNKAAIPLEDGSRIILNIYGGMIGPSGTGKSESLQPAYDIDEMFKATGDSPDIGGNATVGGLIEKLIERDGQTSFFHADEADKVLKDWSNDKGEFRGMKQGITDLYGGRVPAILRATKKEISGIHAKAYLNVHLTGVFEKVTDAIEPGDWESGFINRFVWAVGERKPRTRESKRLRVARGDRSGAGAPSASDWPRKWMIQFMQVVRSLETPDGELAEMDVADDVIERHIETEERLEALEQGSTYQNRLEATFTRLRVTILKCSALVALSDGSRIVQMKHYLIALEQGEEWATNSLAMVRATDESPLVRRRKRLLQHLVEAGGEMAMTDAYQLPTFDIDYRDTDFLLKQLEKQGQIIRENHPVTGAERIRLKAQI
jgi:hypothetical protein